MWPPRNASRGAASCQCFLPGHMSLGVTSATMPAIDALWYTRATLKVGLWRRKGRRAGPGDSDCLVMGHGPCGHSSGAEDVFLGTQFFRFSKVQLPKHPVTDPDFVISGAAFVISGAAASADSEQDRPFLWMTLKKLESGCAEHNEKGLMWECRSAKGQCSQLMVPLS